MSEYDFSHVINMTSVRLAKEYGVCEGIIMFQWSLIHDMLENCDYSKIRIKNFGNFEIKKSFLESYRKKLEKKLENLHDYSTVNNGQRTQNLIQDLETKKVLFEELYKKYSKHEDSQIDQTDR